MRMASGGGDDPGEVRGGGGITGWGFRSACFGLCMNLDTILWI